MVIRGIFVPLINPIMVSEGGKRLARGGQTVSFIGTAPPNRVVITEYSSMEKAQDWRSKAKGAISVGQKYADINIYVAEGVAP